MDTKHIHCMLEDMAEYGKEMISCATGSGNVNLHDAMQIVDMVKDLADAEYHALIAREMRKEHEEEEEEEKYILRMLKEERGMSEEDSRRFYDAWRYKNGRFAPKGRGTRRGYEEPPYYHMMPDYRMDLADYKGKTAEELRDLDRSRGKLYYTEPVRMDGMREMHDRKDGKSWEKRRGYMETKEAHKDNTPQDKQEKMKSLEAYAKDLTEDVIDMVADATPEERNLLRQKMQVLLQKIPQ